jgi:ABC-2 type transport system ATP-binding protein
VLLAAALIHDPELLVLDEPASGLDVPSMLMLRALVDGLRQEGRLVFYSSHELDIVQRVSSRLMILGEGRLVAEGTYQELKEVTGKASLEEVFTQVAVKEDAARTASDMIEVMRKA